MTCFYFLEDFLDFVKLILFFMQRQDGVGDRLVGAGNVVQSAKRRTKKAIAAKSSAVLSSIQGHCIILSMFMQDVQRLKLKYCSPPHN